MWLFNNCNDGITIPVESMLLVTKNWFVSIKIAIGKMIKQPYNVIFLNIYSNTDYISLLDLFSALFWNNGRRGGGGGQKIAQNEEYQLHLSCAISQEPYII